MWISFLWLSYFPYLGLSVRLYGGMERYESNVSCSGGPLDGRPEGRTNKGKENQIRKNQKKKDGKYSANWFYFLAYRIGLVNRIGTCTSNAGQAGEFTPHPRSPGSDYAHNRAFSPNANINHTTPKFTTHRHHQLAPSYPPDDGSTSPPNIQVEIENMLRPPCSAS